MSKRKIVALFIVVVTGATLSLLPYHAAAQTESTWIVPRTPDGSI
jgi:hypothetical protein